VWVVGVVGWVRVVWVGLVFFCVVVGVGVWGFFGWCDVVGRGLVLLWGGVLVLGLVLVVVASNLAFVRSVRSGFRTVPHS